MGQDGEHKIAGPGAREWTAALRRHLVPVIIVFAFCGLIYSNSLNAPFTFDDQLNITENPYIRMTRLNTFQMVRAAVQDRFQLRFLSNLSFALDYYFHRLNLHWMHAENIAIHALAAALLYLVVFTLIPLVTASPPPLSRRRAASALAALVWAAQPAHTQAVTYLVQRQTEMAAAAMLASFLAFVRARGAAGRRRSVLYALSFAAFLIAAGSKETGWFLPVYWLLFVLLLEPRGRSQDRRAMFRVAALLVIAACVVSSALIITGILQTYLSDYQKMSYGPGQRLLTEARVFASYLLTMVFPHPARLSLDHDVAISRSLLDPWTTLPALALVAGVIAAAVLCWNRKPLISFLGLGLLAALAPESTIIPVDLMNDHRLYLAAMFVLPPLVAALALSLHPRRACPLFILIIVMMGLLTMSRNRTWNVPGAIWADAARKSPDLPRPWTNLCGDLDEARMFNRALTACDLAIAHNVLGSQAYTNKALALVALRRKDEAGELLARTAEKYPRDANAQYNYGRYLDLVGKTEQAMEHYNKALEADPMNQRSRIALTRDLRLANEPDQAMKVVGLATVLFPDSVDAWLELARTAVWARQFSAAAAAAMKAFDLEPGPEPLVLYGTAQMLSGDNDAAERAFRAALLYDPMYQRAWMGLAKVDLNKGHRQGAADAAAQVRKSGPLSDELRAELDDLEKQISGPPPAAP